MGLERGLATSKKSAVFYALYKVARRLNDLGVPYAVVGGMALFHGRPRFTEDVNILVTKDGLKTIHERLEGLGYLLHRKASTSATPNSGSGSSSSRRGNTRRHGKPKPVAFPEPGTVGFESEWR